jgi:ketosteroid isomerase-like protein
MRSRATLWVVLLGLLTLLYPRADLHASDTAEITKAIVMLDNERADAQVRRDYAALDRLLGDDLTYVHASGLTQNKADFIADLKSSKRIYTSIKSSDLNVRVMQDTAVITGHSDIHVVHEGKENDLSLRITAVYANRNGRWQLIAYQSTRQTP